MTEASNPIPSHKDPVPSYKQEFEHSVDLFQRTLKEYGKSKSENQKAAFKQVMEKASHVMSETAPQYLKGTDKELVTKLQADYRAFCQNPSSEMLTKLQSDINALKNIS